MDILKVIVLGIVQGLTEFLPVSSSGHLVLAAEILNFHEEGVAFEVFVHLGTLCSVLIAFKEDIIQMIIAPVRAIFKIEGGDGKENYLMWDFYIIIGTIPSAVIGLLYKSDIEAAFTNILLVNAMLLVTGTILLLSRYANHQNKELTVIKSFFIGVAQAFAILPGVSRSGSTIVTGIFLGIKRERAAKFSFILAIPAILGATVIKINDLLTVEISRMMILYMILGALVAFISGYFAIVLLLKVVKKGKLEWFGLYCYSVVLVSFLWYFL